MWGADASVQQAPHRPGQVALGERVRWHFNDVCELSEAAARQALDEAGLAPTDVGTLIFRGLMADGAAACVVHDGTGHGPSIIDSYSYTVPGTADVVGYELDDDGFHGFNSARLLTTIEALIPRLTAWLGDPPRFVVAHPGGPRILRMLAAGLPGGRPCWRRRARASPNTATWARRPRWTSSLAPSTTRRPRAAAAC